MVVGRRIQVAAALFMVFVLTLPGIVSCTTAPPLAPSPTPTPPAPTPIPTGPTGTLVIAQGSLGNERWLPHFNSATEMAIASSIYEFLIYRKPGTSEFMPGLAESWEMSKDGLTWTFNLRKGIQFHESWGELTAADVKQSYDLIVSKESTSTLAPYIRGNVKSVEVPSPYQVVFRMAKPTWDLASQLSSGVANFGIVSKKYIDAVGIDKAAQNPIGSGSFKFVEHKPGQYLKLEALDKHWRKVPQFKTLVYRPVPEEATRLAMLRTGEADIIDISPAAIQEVKKVGFRIVEIPNTKSLAMAFGGLVFPTKPTYDPTIPWVGPDPQRALKVRKAMALAINKQEIIDQVLMGFAKPVAAQFFFADMPQYVPAWKPYPYDPEQSKRLLAEAGYPNGFDMTIMDIIFAGRPEIQPTVEAVALYLGKVGIRSTIKKMDLATLLPLTAARKVGRAIFPINTARFDEPIMLLDRLGTSKGTTFYGAEDTKMDEMSAKALAELDYDKRVNLQREMGQYSIDNYYWIPIASVPTIFAVNKKVGEWPMSPSEAFAHYFEYLTAAK